ncbi:TPA: hypothetical protein ACJEU7_003041 [Acinetobacter baumannii]
MKHFKSKTVKALDNKIIQACNYLSTMLPKGYSANLIVDDLEKNTYELSFSDHEKIYSLERPFLAKLIPVVVDGINMVRVEHLCPRGTRKILLDTLTGKLHHNAYYYSDMIEYHLDDME